MLKQGRFKGIRVLLGVTGSIAAYKGVLILRRLMEEGAQVQVVLTHSAQKFITPLTFEALSGRKVYTDLFGEEESIPHITLADSSDLILIVPATANIIGKVANGIADDLLSTLLMASRVPVILAPAMEEEMWNNPRLQKNIAVLEELGVRVVPPEAGKLASGKEGLGRLASEELILSSVAERLEHYEDLKGEVIVVTAGPTREALDAVRYLSNRSSGKMGYALAKAARERGARVILISGPTQLSPPLGVELARVETAEEMLNRVLEAFPAATVLIMAAAVSDYRPSQMIKGKMKKSGVPLSLDLEHVPDILKRLAHENGSLKQRKTLIGFAAETEDLLPNARKKLMEKDLDLIVANDVTMEGAGFECETNIVTLLDRSGGEETLPILAKTEVARRILDCINPIIKGGSCLARSPLSSRVDRA